jgi:hypothetical protein
MSERSPVGWRTCRHCRQPFRMGEREARYVRPRFCSLACADVSDSHCAAFDAPRSTRDGERPGPPLRVIEIPRVAI